MKKTDIKDIIRLARIYGRNPDMVQAGGGNVSLKSRRYMLVKASGLSLGDLKRKEDFVMIDLESINKMLVDDKILPLSEARLKKETNMRLLAARVGETRQWPSIETFLHAIMKNKFVVHTHPVFINAMTCCDRGRAMASKLFEADQYLWLSYSAPGYPLGRSLHRAIVRHHEKFNVIPDIVFLRNHGLIIAGEDCRMIMRRTRHVINRLAGYFGTYESRTIRVPGKSVRDGWVNDVRGIVRKLFPNDPVRTVWCRDNYANLLCQTKSFMKNIRKNPICPDQVVYCGESPLLLKPGHHNGDIKSQFTEFIRKYKYRPKYILIPDTGIIIMGKNASEVKATEEMLSACAKIVVLIRKKGKPAYLSDDDCRYLARWESEKYRQEIVGKRAGSK